MESMAFIIEEIVSTQPVKIVISNPRHKYEAQLATDNQQIVKIQIKRIRLKQGEAYQIEKFTKTQAFHVNIAVGDLQNVVLTYMKEFRQMNAWCETMEYDVKLSKKEKLLINRRKAAHPVQVDAHNKRKHYLLEEGKVVPALVDLGIFTKDGRVVHAMYDKYKQINRFLEMVDDVLKDYKKEELHIIDFGCGKSYLTFILYYYLTEVRHRKVYMTGLDLKQTVIDKCNETAAKYHYDDLHFELGDINGYQTEEPVDMVVTLHACDTATDYALFNAIGWNANIILSVPCCQHELNQQMESEALHGLLRYGIIKERTAALMTDAIRGELLECCGYRTQLLEFIDIAHSPKNILIRAVKTDVSEKKRQQAYCEVKNLMDTFGLQPTLERRLRQAGYLDAYFNMSNVQKQAESE